MERLLLLELVKPWSCKRCGMGSRLILTVPKHFSCKSLWKTPLIQSLMNVRERAVYRVKNSESIRMLGSQSCLWFFSLCTATNRSWQSGPAFSLPYLLQELFSPYTQKEQEEENSTGQNSSCFIICTGIIRKCRWAGGDQTCSSFWWRKQPRWQENCWLQKVFYSKFRKGNKKCRRQ